MSSTAVATAKPTRLDVVLSEVLTPENKSALARSLPAHIKPERFERNLANALMNTPELMDLNRSLLWREVAKMSQLGLSFDPLLGEAYLMASWDTKAGGKVPLARVGYRGMMKLARQSGEIAGIYSHAVHANDKITATLGVDKVLIHEPVMFGERGPIIGYYAVVKYKDGTSDFEPMSLGEIHEIRDRSDAWKAFKAGKIKTTPWATDEPEMAKKTTIRRLLKRVAMSPELADAWRHEAAADDRERGMIDVTPPADTSDTTRITDFSGAAVPPLPAGATDIEPAPTPADPQDPGSAATAEAGDGAAETTVGNSVSAAPSTALTSGYDLITRDGEVEIYPSPEKWRDAFLEAVGGFVDEADPEGLRAFSDTNKPAVDAMKIRGRADIAKYVGDETRKQLQAAKNRAERKVGG